MRFLLLVTLCAACTTPDELPFLPTPGRPLAQEGRFADPFAYCTVVDATDEPDERYVGPKVPRTIVNGLRKALQIPAEAHMAETILWRCVKGKVLACNVGANIPCTEKADTSCIPRPEMVKFCKANPDSCSIPAAVTGRATIYAWRCTNGEPAIVRQVYTPDARGFLSEVWHEIPAPHHGG